jgi:hypothetical protein
MRLTNTAISTTARILLRGNLVAQRRTRHDIDIKPNGYERIDLCVLQQAAATKAMSRRTD